MIKLLMVMSFASLAVVLTAYQEAGYAPVRSPAFVLMQNTEAKRPLNYAGKYDLISTSRSELDLALRLGKNKSEICSLIKRQMSMAKNNLDRKGSVYNKHLILSYELNTNYCDESHLYTNQELREKSEWVLDELKTYELYLEENSDGMFKNIQDVKGLVSEVFNG